MTQPKPPTDITAKPELHQHTPICVPCQRNYRCELNGIKVRLGPNIIIDADMYKCPGCGHLIVKGFANRYIARHDPSDNYRRIFASDDERMGDAAITDYKGRAIDVDPDTAPSEGAPEAGANQEHRDA